MTAIEVRRAEDRGTTRTGWLSSRHSFSFGRYRDPKQRGIPPLRVLNDDRVDPGAGFDPHPHRDMEILSYVLEGTMRHEDSRGHEGIVRSGEVQFMRAGTGVVHSEYNASDEDVLRFLQIWFQPRRRGLEPTYEKMRADPDDDGSWTPLASGWGDPDDAIPIEAEAAMLTARVPAGTTTVYDDAVPDRHVYLFVIEGEVQVADVTLGRRDAAHVRDTGRVEVDGREDAHLLLFELDPDATAG